jgi:CheY-like chemotaxis protein/HPt (histidine-containing phosphotransfer) domain-containing protein
VNRSVLDRMLAQLHVTADVAASGREAVEAAHAHPYDLILMDLEMPGIDGFEATRRIRATETANRHARIAALSAHSSDDARQSATEAGMDDFLAKPVHIDELRAALRRIAPPGLPSARGARLPAGTPSLDVSRLMALAETNGKTDRRFLRRLFRTFRAETRQHLADLERSVRRRRAEPFRRSAHALKSASGEVGAGPLRGLAEQLERLGERAAADEGSLEDAWPLITQARAEARAVTVAWPVPGASR